MEDEELSSSLLSDQLTPLETFEIEFIKGFEKSRGRSITDREHQIFHGAFNGRQANLGRQTGF